MRNFPILVLAALFVFMSCTRSEHRQKSDTDWPKYGGNSAGNRYAGISQINVDNVKNLHVAWKYNTVDPPDPKDTTKQDPMAIQCQPIVVDGILYGTAGDLKLFALDAATGKRLWKFTPPDNEKKYNISRGVVYWEANNDKRIIYSVGSKLYAINATNGKPISSFGDKGAADLHTGLQEGLENDVSQLSVSATSPGVVYKNTLVIGSSVSESGDAAPGYIRGFDVVTGKLKWVFHTIPRPGEYGYETWPKDAWKEFGGVNSWSGMVVDDKRGDVYFGTGSASADFYGGNREGSNLFATCIMALNAETGKMKWFYQTIHHDLWDRDHPTPPNLTTVMHNGKKVDVVVQATKDGLVYVLDRDNGTSLFPVNERPAPTKGLPGEHPFPTQKYPVSPLPFSTQVFTAADITNISKESHDYVKKQYLEYKTDDKFSPPTIKGTIAFGYSGGAEWGGNSIDPDGILYQNGNNAPWILQMIDTASRNKELASVSQGNALFLTNCASCHGQDRKGSDTQFPNLVRIGDRRTPEEILSIIKAGRGRMPSFQRLAENDRKAIVGFLLNPRAGKHPGSSNEHAEAASTATKTKAFGFQARYVNRVWKKLTDQDGYPGVKPPWGTLNAINLNTGAYMWTVRLGEYPELTKKGIPLTGTESYGGPISTAGGLVFIAGTKDEKIRAFNKKNGQMVWQFQLPAGGFATPITYVAGGKQYVVIAAGGGRGQKPGGEYIAFALK